MAYRGIERLPGAFLAAKTSGSGVAALARTMALRRYVRSAWSVALSASVYWPCGPQYVAYAKAACACRSYSVHLDDTRSQYDVAAGTDDWASCTPRSYCAAMSLVSPAWALLIISAKSIGAVSLSHDFAVEQASAPACSETRCTTIRAVASACIAGSRCFVTRWSARRASK